MKAGRNGLIAVVGGIIMLLLVSGPAIGKPGFAIQKPSLDLEMSLRGTNGYKITIRTVGPRFILLSASKDDVSANYFVAGRATRDGLDANFGSLGHVSVRFHGSPHRQEEEPLAPLKCIKGNPPIYEVGRFEGTIQFHGEQDFTSASARKARGTVLRSFRQVCEQPASQPSKGKVPAPHQNRSDEGPATVLIAGSNSEGRTVYLESASSEIPATARHPSLFTAVVIAGTLERRGGVAIERSVLLLGDKRSVLVSTPTLEQLSATVSLPKPFSGKASYNVTGDGLVSWEGSLAVSLPGARKVPLTGEGFKAALCHAESADELDPCLKDIDFGPSGLVR